MEREIKKPRVLSADAAAHRERRAIAAEFRARSLMYIYVYMILLVYVLACIKLTLLDNCLIYTCSVRCAFAYNSPING